MTTLYRSKVAVTMEHLDNIPREILEKKLVMDFLHSIPLEELKRLTGFKETNFREHALWESSIKDRDLFEQLCQLRRDNQANFNFKILLDTEDGNKKQPTTRTK